MKEKELKETKNTLDTHAPDRPEMQQLSEEEKKQIELGGLIEHEHGERREQLEEEVEKTEEDKKPS